MTNELTPLNIWSGVEEEVARLMSRFAHTPFVLDGVNFASVEALDTWLLVGDNPRRKAKVAAM